MKRTLAFILLCIVALRASAADFADARIFCGYQGWFRCESDGTGTGWHHYAAGKSFEPGACGIDLWPDVRELPATARFATPFRHPDGTVAEVFTSAHPGTVRTHFGWMREYGIDAVFLQRFAATARDPRFRKPMDDVMKYAADAARVTSRAWAVMYDLSGLAPDQFDSLKADWKRVDEQFHLRNASEHPDYLRLHDRPLVALWGCGFTDRPAALDQWRGLISFFKDDPQFGGCAVMLGVPAFWRTLDRDALTDPALHEILASADVISPWSVARYRTPDDAARFATRTVAPDIAWCRERKLEYLPVVFPGFSWHNLSASRGKDAPLDQIPRLGGRFLWSQCVNDSRAGARSLYVAMFDEIDEGTAIFKVRNDPPAGASRFVAEPGVSSDQYLWLAGAAGRLLKGELSADSAEFPIRQP